MGNREVELSLRKGQIDENEATVAQHRRNVPGRRAAIETRTPLGRDKKPRVRTMKKCTTSAGPGRGANSQTTERLRKPN